MSRAAEVRAAGDAAVLVEAGPEPGAAASLAAAIAALGLPGVTDIVPGAATVLVVTEPADPDVAGPGTADPCGARPGGSGLGCTGLDGTGLDGTGLGWLMGRLRALLDAPLPPAPATGTTPVTIPVCYDGPDLADVARLTGLSAREVAERHQAGEYRVGWLGFAPGFGYLTGLDPALAQVPRLATPRQKVPAGSVAIAGGLTAVYPSASPGGWHLIGRTTARLWDPAREPPALFAPGMPVRFRAVSAAELAASGAEHRPHNADPDGAPAGGSPAGGSPAGGSPAGGSPGRATRAGAIEVVRPGPLATVQDLGRTGYAHLGVPRSGAADPGSLRLANRLVGNADDAAGLEFTLGQAVLRFHAPAVIAVTGAPVPATIEQQGRRAEPDDEPDVRVVPPGEAIELPAGSVLRLRTPPAGLRTYLAVRGGIDVPAVLGSRSADLLSGLGPAPLRPGDRLPVGPPPATTPDQRSHAHPHPSPSPRAAGAPDADGVVTLRAIAGPRDDWFGAAALELLDSETFRVTPASNRTGLRLTGPGLPRGRTGELPSEGMVAGALQVPPDGQPILLLADHPATGGYPVIAVLRTADIGRAAQLRPGQLVRFAVSPPPN